MYRIAHFSDFHLTGLELEYFRALAMIHHAIEIRGVDHLVICGDIVDSSKIEVYSSFIDSLAAWGWASPERLTVVPGNHDVFSNLARIREQKGPQARFEKLCAITQRTRHSTLIADGDPVYGFPFGKELTPDVVLCGLDSTITNAGMLLSIKGAGGELSQTHRDACSAFFSKHKQARHRILVMHHCPIDLEFSWGGIIEQNFVDPPVDVVQSWIKTAKATLVLCGHVHENESYRIGRNCRVLVSGNSGGCETNRSERSYSLIGLPTNAAARCSTQTLNADELDDIIDEDFA